MAESPISNKVREMRFHSGEMTQQELAEIVGVTRQTIVAIEKQRYSPSLELAFRIARAFACGVEDVFRFEQDPDTTNGGTK
ncbi:MAG: transcriptional regulator [Spirochaetaceae bacterium]|nr:MAG: transcriptional regulator [Spirochaetaceae bacterium]